MTMWSAKPSWLNFSLYIVTTLSCLDKVLNVYSRNGVNSMSNKDVYLCDFSTDLKLIGIIMQFYGYVRIYVYIANQIWILIAYATFLQSCQSEI